MFWNNAPEPKYCALYSDAAGELIKAVEISATNDEMAIEAVEAFEPSDFVIELWEGERRIARFEPA